MRKTRFILQSGLLCAILVPPVVWAQDRIYRCGNEYTNNATQARERGCKAVDGGNITVVQSPPRSSAPVAGTGGKSTAASPAGAPKVDNNEQRSRDADARVIFDAELRKAQTRLADLQKEYNNGAPEKSALEMRNVQLYIERTAEIKANIARTESDIASIQREIGRLK